MSDGFFYDTVGEPEDHGWQNEWEIKDGYTFKNGKTVTREFVSLGPHQRAAATAARIHFSLILSQTPIGQG